MELDHAARVIAFVLPSLPDGSWRSPLPTSASGGLAWIQCPKTSARTKNEGLIPDLTLPGCGRRHQYLSDWHSRPGGSCALSRTDLADPASDRFRTRETHIPGGFDARHRRRKQLMARVCPSGESDGTDRALCAEPRGPDLVITDETDTEAIQRARELTFTRSCPAPSRRPSSMTPSSVASATRRRCPADTIPVAHPAKPRPAG